MGISREGWDLRDGTPTKEKHQQGKNLSKQGKTPNKEKPFHKEKHQQGNTKQGKTFPNKEKHQQGNTFRARRNLSRQGKTIPVLHHHPLEIPNKGKHQTRENTKQGNTNKGNAFRARGIFRSDVKVVVGVFRQGKAVVSDVWVWCYWWWMFISMG